MTVARKVKFQWWMPLPVTGYFIYEAITTMTQAAAFESQGLVPPDFHGWWFVAMTICGLVLAAITLFLLSDEYNKDPIHIPVPALHLLSKEDRLKRDLNEARKARSEVAAALARMDDQGVDNALRNNLVLRKEELDKVVATIETEIGYQAYADLDKRVTKVIRRSLKG